MNKELKNIKLTITYDGGAYFGWQKTNIGPSIEETLQNVLAKIFQEELKLQACSRTDAGVHADGQIVNFKTQKHIPSFDKLKNSLNRLLPKDIAVLRIEEARPSFHPTLDCRAKEYHYRVSFGELQLPKERFYSWHYPYRLDIQEMRKAALLLEGEHDFSAFCNYKKCQKYAHYIRNVEKILIKELPGKKLRFCIKGNSFLYKMVRNIVGTLIYVGCGKILLSDIPKILANKTRLQAGVTAPAHGLTLHKIYS